ncbi:MAG: hypothetical protein WCR42_08925 [bacterium]
MKSLRNILLCLIIATLSLSAQSGLAQDKSSDSTASAPKIILDNISDFFTLLSEHDFEKAYQQILAKSPLLNDKQNLDKLIKETSKIEEFYGKLDQYEYFKTEIVTKSYIRVSCLGLCTKHPMRWIFTYYNSPETGWLVTNIKFDDLTENYFMGK